MRSSLLLLKIGSHFILYGLQFGLLISLIFGIWENYFALLDDKVIKIAFAFYLIVLSLSISKTAEWRGKMDVVNHLKINLNPYNKNELHKRNQLEHMHAESYLFLAGIFKVEAYFLTFWSIMQFLNIAKEPLFFGTNLGRFLLFLCLSCPFFVASFFVEYQKTKNLETEQFDADESTYK